MLGFKKITALLLVAIMCLTFMTSSMAVEFSAKEWVKYNDLTIDIPFIKGYEGNLFKPEKEMTRAEACTVILRLIADENQIKGKNTSKFTDINAGDWYYDNIAYLESEGYLDAYEKEFMPNQPITRAEFVELAVKALEIKAPAQTKSFIDVPADHMKYEYVTISASAGIISGYPNGTFKPDDTINRAEVVKVLCAALGRTPTNTSFGYIDVKGFDDVENTHWAYPYVLEATYEHTAVINDKNNEAWIELADTSVKEFVVIEYDNGDRYEGYVNKGEDLPNGYGKYILSTGAVFGGYFGVGRLDGFGYLMINGGEYRGQLVAGEESGYGLYLYTNGEAYEGYIVDSLRQGYSIRTMPNGDKLEGNFTAFDGIDIGIYTQADGTVKLIGGESEKGYNDESYTGINKSIKIGNDDYDGEVTKLGIPHGFGLYRFENGDAYLGDHVKGEMTGFGLYTWANGDYYLGDFENGDKTGYGMEVKANGEIFVGNFNNGEYEKGIFYHADGTVTTL